MSDGRTWGAVVGAVAGYFTGGLSYVATGITVGSAVGGLLEPKKRTETNRIDDIKVSLSKYGDGIPETWGNNIPSATCVWSTYIIELPEESSGGKGGGVQNTNYRQFIQSMWCLGRTPELVEGERPVIAIRRAWIDGKLNYDASSGIPAGQALATEENPFASIALLPGWDDQLPVPMIETYEGVGNVPAFRGRICLFIFGLECPGGRVPQLQFELAVGADLVDIIYLGEGAIIPTGAQISASRLSSDGANSVFFSEYEDVSDDPGTHKRVRVYSLSLSGAVLLNEFSYGSEYWGIYTGLQGDADIDALCFRQVSPEDLTDSGFNIVVDQEGNRIAAFELGDDFLAFGQTGSTWSKRGEYFMIGGDSLTPDRVGLFGWDSGVLFAMADIPYQEKVILTDATAWVLVGGTDPRTLQARTIEPAFTLLDSQALPAETAGYIIHLTSSEGDVLSLVASDEDTGNHMLVYAVTRVGPDIVFTLQNEATRVDGAIPHPLEPTIGVSPRAVFGWTRLEVAEDTTLQAFMIAFDRVEANQASVQGFIRSQCLRAGLSEDQFDVTTIDDEFHGLTIKSPGSARANIAPLLTYSAIGVVEEDQLLRFFNRKDKTSVVTVPYEDLGFAEDGSEPGDPFPLVRTNAQELPRSITLSYNDPNFDYQISTVKAMRYAVDSVLDVNETLDMAMTGDRAATIVYRLMFERWLAQNTRSCAVSRKYAANSAGDVVTILSKTGSYGDWMLSKVTDTGVRIEWEMFPSDSDLLIQVVPGPQSYRAQVMDELPSPTRQQLLDIPILRDTDNNPGIYDAFAPISGAWRGATLYSGDDDNSLSDRGTVFSAAPMGVAESVLGDWMTYEMDEANTMIVNAAADTFSAVTRDALIDNPALNVAAFGKPGRWEIIQFASPVYLGGSQWLVSRFLRGLRGTEHNRGNHQSGDALVMLVPAGMLRPNMDVGALGLEKKYRAISLGRSMNSAASQTYANTGEGLKPFSPAGLRYDFDGDDIVFEIDRRTRLSNNWTTGVLPLGEASERYQLRLYTDSTFTTVLRVFASTTPTVTYTQAQQTTDGYTPGDPLYARVGQISDSVGLGHELEATL